ncbi:hypothetical protein [Maribacter sp. 2304DJ31-5]|uniref:hypothetical protein n=1 Tax=Maribacter sp. 2304DJ31-5 TaxID=3386273 RepID=UPI0039BD5C3A
MSQNKTLTPIKFNFVSLHFEPYAEVKKKHNTRSILKEVFEYLRSQKKLGKGHLIDRHENRDGSESRELFMTTSRILPKEERIICTMALLRKGRAPKLKPRDKFKLLPIREMGDIAEVTHFFIDFTTSTCVVCAEYNHHGPRISDFEFYLRNIANNNILGLARQTDVNVYFESTLDKTLSQLQNVLHIDIKSTPGKLAQMDADVRQNYFSGMSNIGSVLKPKHIRIESYFQTQGKTIVTNSTNTEANNMFKDMLGVFKKRPRNIKCFEDFVVKYEDKNGMDEVFNLLRGKKEFTKDIDLKANPKLSQFYTLIKPEINDFVTTL